MTEETKTIDQSKLIDHMKYLPGMEVIDSDMLDQVVAIHDSFNNDDFTEKDVRLALSKEHLDPRDFMALLSTAAAPFLEEMAQKAHLVTRRHFGNNITILTPIYFANYCDNYCIYCGFNSHNKIKRARLTDEELHRECKNIADTGIEEVIMLTGESPKMSDIKYIATPSRLPASTSGSSTWKSIRSIRKTINISTNVAPTMSRSSRKHTIPTSMLPSIWPATSASSHTVSIPRNGLSSAACAASASQPLRPGRLSERCFGYGHARMLMQRKYPHAEFPCPVRACARSSTTIRSTRGRRRTEIDADYLCLPLVHALCQHRRIEPRKRPLS